MKYIFHPDAEKELNTAVNFYEQHQEGLGYDFSLEVQKTIHRIIEYPEAWPKMNDQIRRSLVLRFPFGILYHYTKGNKLIYIIAIMHLRKAPGYWTDRME